MKTLMLLAFVPSLIIISMLFEGDNTHAGVFLVLFVMPPVFLLLQLIRYLANKKPQMPRQNAASRVL